MIRLDLKKWREENLQQRSCKINGAIICKINGAIICKKDQYEYLTGKEILALDQSRVTDRAR